MSGDDRIFWARRQRRRRKTGSQEDPVNLGCAQLTGLRNDLTTLDCNKNSLFFSIYELFCLASQISQVFSVK